ncbi:MAG: GNAT family N-acetyltransferase [Bacilli bacterium]
MIIKLDNNNNINLLNSLILTKQEVLKELDNNPFANFLCYRLNDKIVGYIYYSVIYDRIEINNIEVDKFYRNKKIATKLLSELIKENKDITLEVNIENAIAMKLYKNFGFEEKAIRKGYYNGIDGVLMERKA